MDKVKVGVRVRGFLPAEQHQDAKKVVRVINGMGSDTIEFEHIRGLRTYQFEHGFDSINPDEGPYATQETVYDDIGKYLVDAVSAGKNACLFVHGEQKSGKTTSLLGDETHGKGVLPRALEEIFATIDQKANDSKINYEKKSVRMSYASIYCEECRDLLSPKDEGLKLRFINGSIAGLTELEVADAKTCMGYIQQARRMRAVGEQTQDYRFAHVIFTLTVEDIRDHNPVVSKLAMVDLAGSDCAEKITGDSVEDDLERSGVHNSLAALRKVFHLKSTGVSVIDFNMSALTLFLKDHLEGNSMLALLACISPASTSRNETFKTLRWSLLVKEMKLQAVVNNLDVRGYEDELNRSLIDLKSRLAAGSDPQMIDDIQSTIDVIQDRLTFFSSSVQENLQRSRKWEAKIAEYLEDNGLSSEELDDVFMMKEPTPKLVNISTDSSLSGVLFFFCRYAVNNVGTSDWKEKPDILLQKDKRNPNAIKPHHAILRWDKKDQVLTVEPAPVDSKLGAPSIRVNGQSMTIAKELFNGDYILFGQAHRFQVRHPTKHRGDRGFELMNFEDAVAVDRAWDKTANAVTVTDKLQKELLKKMQADERKKYQKAVKKAIQLNKSLVKAVKAERKANERIQQLEATAQSKDAALAEAMREKAELEAWKKQHMDEIHELKGSNSALMSENRMKQIAAEALKNDIEQWRNKHRRVVKKALQAKKQAHSKINQELDDAMKEAEAELRRAQAAAVVEEDMDRARQLKTQADELASLRTNLDKLTDEKRSALFERQFLALNNEQLKTKLMSTLKKTLQLKAQLVQEHNEAMNKALADLKAEMEADFADKLQDAKTDGDDDQVDTLNTALSDLEAEVKEIQVKVADPNTSQRQLKALLQSANASLEKRGWQEKYMALSKKMLKMKRQARRDADHAVADQMEKDRTELERQIAELKAQGDAREVKLKEDHLRELEEAKKSFRSTAMADKVNPLWLEQALKAEKNEWQIKYKKLMKKTLELKKQCNHSKLQDLEALRTQALEDAELKVAEKMAALEKENAELKDENTKLKELLEIKTKELEDAKKNRDESNDQVRDIVGKTVESNEDLQKLMAEAAKTHKAEMDRVMKAHQAKVSELEKKIADLIEEGKQREADRKLREKERLEREIQDDPDPVDPLIGNITSGEDTNFDEKEPSHKLVVTICQAFDLAPKDWSGYSDPYCTIECLKPDGIAVYVENTPKRESTLNPSWYQSWDITMFMEVASTLRVSVWDDDPFKNEFMGQIELDIKSITPPNGQTVTETYTLEKRQEKDQVKGQIRLTFASIEINDDNRITTFLLNQSKPWQLTDDDLDLLWKTIKGRTPAAATKDELLHDEAVKLCHAWFKKQVTITSKATGLTEKQTEENFLRNRPLDNHIQNFCYELMSYFDVNQDGHVLKHEFFRRWNAFAKRQFGDPDDSCVIC